jgi:DNA-binding response OmpR family regulator
MPVTQRKDAGRAPGSRGLEPVAPDQSVAELESCPQPERVVTVLVISPVEEDHLILRNLFSHSKWHVDGVSKWESARVHLTLHRTPVVICERDLPDGDWKEVLTALSEFDDPPLLIITSRLADDYLWAEVLNLGGYDVLMKPFEPAEVFRVVSLAWLNWKENRERRRLQATLTRVALAAG